MMTPDKPTTGAATPADGNANAANGHNAAHTVTDPLAVLREAGERRPGGLKITTMSTHTRRWPTFLYPARVPDSGLTLLSGDPGLGKSTWTVHLAALVTQGKLGPAAPVMFALGEDGLDVFDGRLEAAGADLALVDVFEGGESKEFCLPDGVPELLDSAKRRKARLVILDPLENFLAQGINTKDSASYRSALRPLNDMAQKLRLAVVVVNHFNKGQGQSAMYRSSGSLGGLAGSIRSQLVFTLDPEDPDDEQGRRALGHSKNNWGAKAPTEIYRHTSVELPDADGREFSVSRLDLVGESAVPADELVSGDSDDTPQGKLERAGEVLADELGDGEWHRKSEIVEVAKRLGISGRTLDRAAKLEEVTSKQEGRPAVAHWRLPRSATTLGEPGLANLPLSHRQANSGEPEGQVRQTPEYGEPRQPGARKSVSSDNGPAILRRAVSMGGTPRVFDDVSYRIDHAEALLIEHFDAERI